MTTVFNGLQWNDSVFLPCTSLEVVLLKSSWVVWGSTVSSPSKVWGGAPAEIEFSAF